MGILYGSMVANLVPVLLEWWSLPTGFVRAPAPIPETLRWAIVVMGVGVFLSGARDLYAAFELPCGGWPWDRHREASDDENHPT